MFREENDETILLVDDDRSLSALLREELEDKGFAVETTTTTHQARKVLQSSDIDLLVTDLRLPKEHGTGLLDDLNALADKPATLVITGFGSIEQAVDCLKRGADDFLAKPLDMDHFISVVERLLEIRRLHSKVKRLRDFIGKPDYHGLVGQSRCMREMFCLIAQMAKGPGPILVLGESGTGKELVARAIHMEGERADGPFVPVNCAAIPKELVESELFGYEAGAFTGASRRRDGLFAQADRGTLFLDEIAEMPLALQAKLLRVLQDGGVRPLGASRERKLDVRIVAATNQPLSRLVEKGEFREDLYFRLETFTIQVPPLRERDDDIELLAGHFLENCVLRQNKGVKQFHPDVLAVLRAYSYPGNVRELANAIERAVTFATGQEIGLAELPERLRHQRDETAGGTGPEDEPLRACSQGAVLPTLQELQGRYIRYVLEQVGGNKRRAAALLGIGRRTLYRYLE